MNGFLRDKAMPCLYYFIPMDNNLPRASVAKIYLPWWLLYKNPSDPLGLILKPSLRLPTISIPNYQLLIKGHRYYCNPFECFA
jgi:hypothetical protein